MTGILHWLSNLIGSTATSPSVPTLPRVDFKKLEQVLQYTIKNKELFTLALSHRSYLPVADGISPPSNERLEFLGDSILNFVVAEYLYKHYTNAPEGDLTKIRSRLVNRKALSLYAYRLHLENFILLGNCSVRQPGKGIDKILADAFEAVIAALYLDGGYSNATEFVQRQILAALEMGIVKVEDENFKSQLLEYSQGEGFGIPRYVTIKEEGPDHDRIFTVEVYVNNEPCGVGMGKNKKEAEQAAAEKALQKFQLL
jgi:ribonuclease-3